MLWFSGSGNDIHGAVEGWFNTKVYMETKDEAKAQGWAPFILDTNGNGKRDAWVEPISQWIRRKINESTLGSMVWLRVPWTVQFGDQR